VLGALLNLDPHVVVGIQEYPRHHDKLYAQVSEATVTTIFSTKLSNNNNNRNNNNNNNNNNRKENRRIKDII
jgi:hypothetical protein